MGDVRKKTVKAFEAWAADPAHIEDVISQVLEGKKVEMICPKIRQPFRLLWPLLNSEEWKAKFDGARKGYADRLVEKALEVVENVKAVKEEVARAKLQSETYLGVAGKWDRDRYGDQADVKVNVTQWVMRLPSPAGSTAEWRAGVEKVINSVPAPALESPARGDDVLEPAPRALEPATT